MKKILLYIVLAGFIVGILASWYIGAVPLFAAHEFNSSLIALSRLLGLAAAFLLVLQFILIGRVKWVESVFGLDKLSRVHRTNGLVIFGLIIAHPILMIIAYAKLSQIGFITQYISFLGGYGDILAASIGVFMLIGTIFLSLTIVRRKLKYEWWYYVHIFNYLAASLIFLHIKEMTSTSVYWEWPAFWIALYVLTALNVIWFRFIRPVIKFYRHQFTVSKVEDLGFATSIYISGLDMDKFKITAGQFMIFRFLQKGFRTQAHPFSMSMAPNGKEIRLTAKKLGDFTNELPNLRVGTKVLIDGPHGLFTENLINKNKVLFVAGGIGITPIRSILESMGNRVPDKVLLYSNKAPAEVILGGEITELSKKYHFPVINIFADTQVPGAEFGRLDGAMLGTLVPDITDRDIFLCGPPPMMTALRQAMIELGVPKSQIHYERFAL